MAWQTPKTDWMPPDGVRDTDINRIEGNIQHLYNETLRTDTYLYVNASSGNDTTGNGSLSAPFKTITKALSMLPRKLNGNTAFINIDEGSYNEAVYIAGFDGPITLGGSPGDIVEVNSLRVDGCHCSLSDIEISSGSTVFVTSGGTLTGEGSLHVEGATLNVNYGATLSLASVSCDNATNYAIHVNKGARFYAASLYGSGNKTGIVCQGGGIAAFGANNLEADVLYATDSGGRIYTEAQYSVPEF